VLFLHYTRRRLGLQAQAQNPVLPQKAPGLSIILLFFRENILGLVPGETLSIGGAFVELAGLCVKTL